MVQKWDFFPEMMKIDPFTKKIVFGILNYNGSNGHKKNYPSASMPTSEVLAIPEMTRNNPDKGYRHIGLGQYFTRIIFICEKTPNSEEL